MEFKITGNVNVTPPAKGAEDQSFYFGITLDGSVGKTTFSSSFNTYCPREDVLYSIEKTIRAIGPTVGAAVCADLQKETIELKGEYFTIMHPSEMLQDNGSNLGDQIL